MQVMKYAFFVVVGIAAQACGGGSDGDGGGGGEDEGNGGSSSGSGGNGGSSNGGTTANGGSGNGGSGNGGSSSGTTGNGGTAGTSGGGCPSGQVSLFDVPECEEFYSCVFDAACAQAGAQQQLCIDIIKQGLQSSACYPAGTDLATACETTKADPTIAAMYPQCV